VISADEVRRARLREDEVKRNNDRAPDSEEGTQRSLSSLIKAMMSREAAEGRRNP
jgi:hypothetical protein